MVAQSPNTRVHFEMASFAEAELLHRLTQYVTPYADSLGMNEQVKQRLSIVFILNTRAKMFGYLCK
jgi:ADP-dependent glucokinase